MTQPSLRTVLIVGLMAFFVGASAACRGERTYTVEVKDGVRYVHNLKPVSEKPVADLSFVRKIGELESKDPDFQFARPDDGRFRRSGQAGRVYDVFGVPCFRS